jgi:integrase
LRWDQVDFKRGCIIIENTKNSEIREVHMNTTLTETLQSLKVNASEDYVFSRCRRIMCFHDVDILTVKELLGHKTITMTMRYSNLSQEHKKRAVESIDGHKCKFQ